ncbi:MAG: 50S ribosomal protein L30 [Thermoanaerobaculia bacterium]|jgi:LSU ribosomal protein L30P|nr:50S ribosomal protein L30 [Thermoanaerobaculia bacterium]
MAEKEKSSKKDVDALLTEVASAAGVPKKAAKPTGAAAAPAKAPALAARAPAKAAAPEAGKKTVRIRQVKSGICAPVDQKQTLKGLGLRRIRHEVVRPDTPALRGQILKVRHLVEVVGE